MADDAPRKRSVRLGVWLARTRVWLIPLAGLAIPTALLFGYLYGGVVPIITTTVTVIFLMVIALVGNLYVRVVSTLYSSAILLWEPWGERTVEECRRRRLPDAVIAHAYELSLYSRRTTASVVTLLWSAPSAIASAIFLSASAEQRVAVWADRLFVPLCFLAFVGAMVLEVLVYSPVGHASTSGRPLEQP